MRQVLEPARLIDNPAADGAGRFLLWLRVGAQRWLRCVGELEFSGQLVNGLRLRLCWRTEEKDER